MKDKCMKIMSLDSANMNISQLWQCLSRKICSLTSYDKRFDELCCL